MTTTEATPHPTRAHRASTLPYTGTDWALLGSIIGAVGVLLGAVIRRVA